MKTPETFLTETDLMETITILQRLLASQRVNNVKGIEGRIQELKDQLNSLSAPESGTAPSKKPRRQKMTAPFYPLVKF